VTPAEVAASFPPIPDDLAERIAALMVTEQAA
jgi:hypothetical protein